MLIEFNDNNVIITNIKNFNIAQTLDCGQAFRWSKNDDEVWQGIAFGKLLRLKQDEEKIILFDTTKKDFEKIWLDYFDLNRDYAQIIDGISHNETLKNAAKYGNGIRILRQDSWEALCSFIISQNNNIPRIKGIVERLCENFGDKIEGGYTFPTAEKISLLSLDDLAVLRSGFRAKYILDAAKRVASGEICFAEIEKLSTDEARQKLMCIYGVGAKVADCAMLYGMGRLDAFPKDVWIKRALEVLFDGELPEAATCYAGIIQQYIFFYARETKLNI